MDKNQRRAETVHIVRRREFNKPLLKKFGQGCKFLS
jgi:hypothetical protein